MLKSKQKITKVFIDDSFLLQNELAEKLFHLVAKDLPIIDYHNHLNPVHLAENKNFSDITELWVQDDPYKHRAMRINGIPENTISGKASPKEKLLAWAKTLPHTLGNPLFHWSSLELKRVFDIDEMLSEDSIEDIWETCNAKLQEDGFGAKDILKKFKAEIICTSDDLLDDLNPHKRASDLDLMVTPSLRADAVIALDVQGYVEKMSLKTKEGIKSLDDYKSVILHRLDYFELSGCLLADHALDAGFIFKLPSEAEAKSLFMKLIRGNALTNDETIQLKSHLLVFLGEEYGRRGWIMQLHIGAQRFTSSRLRMLAGPAGGFACIGNACDMASLCSFLDTLEKKCLLPKTILYTLNPVDNQPFASLTGSFAEDGVKGKIQFGPAWWYNDHLNGLKDHLVALSSNGLLSHFIGMTTDSRSVLSFSRHEYFRRVLCNVLGKWAKAGHLPNDFQLLGQLVTNICYGNIKNWLEKE